MGIFWIPRHTIAWRLWLIKKLAGGMSVIVNTSIMRTRIECDDTPRQDMKTGILCGTNMRITGGVVDGQRYEI